MVLLRGTRGNVISSTSLWSVALLMKEGRVGKPFYSDQDGETSNKKLCVMEIVMHINFLAVHRCL